LIVYKQESYANFFHLKLELLKPTIPLNMKIQAAGAVPINSEWK